jgi:adenylate cyclase
MPTFPKILDYVWRRHLQVAARREAAREASDGDRDTKVVGFADLVGFTALSQQVDEHILASVVDRFESIAYDTVVTLGGRVVKMIGDEVMFVVDDIPSAVEIALTLSEAYSEDDQLSEVRVGMASGPVLEREADYYGPTVNLASRIVNIAFPGTVVVSDDIHAGLEGDLSFSWRSLKQRRLKDIGKVSLWSVRRAGDDDGRGSVRERDRRRKAERWERGIDRLSEPEEPAAS